MGFLVLVLQMMMTTTAKIINPCRKAKREAITNQVILLVYSRRACLMLLLTRRNKATQIILLIMVQIHMVTPYLLAVETRTSLRLARPWENVKTHGSLPTTSTMDVRVILVSLPQATCGTASKAESKKMLISRHGTTVFFKMRRTGLMKNPLNMTLMVA